MGTKAIDIRVKTELMELCAEVHAYADADCEITIGGNGVNACECVPMANAVLRIIGVDVSSTTFGKMVDSYRKELEGD